MKLEEIAVTIGSHKSVVSCTINAVLKRVALAVLEAKGIDPDTLGPDQLRDFYSSDYLSELVTEALVTRNTATVAASAASIVNSLGSAVDTPIRRHRRLQATFHCDICNRTLRCSSRNADHAARCHMWAANNVKIVSQ